MQDTPMTKRTVFALGLPTIKIENHVAPANEAASEIVRTDPPTSKGD